MNLYHYTGLLPFQSIIKNREFWAFHFGHMNDTQEYKWVLNLSEKYISEIQEKEQSPLSIKFADIYTQMEARQSLLFPFIISFSSKKDDLNQWRSYSKGGAGISLEVELKAEIREFTVKEILKNWSLTFEYKSTIPTHTWHQTKVEYISEEEENDLRSYIFETFDWLKSRHEGKASKPKDIDSDIELIAYYLWVVSLGIKHDSFEEEQEHRIFYLAPIKMDTLQYDEKFLKEEINYFVNDTTIKPYIKMKIDGLLEISGVIAGPKYEGNMWDLNDILLKHDFTTVNLDNSKIPYR